MRIVFTGHRDCHCDPAELAAIEAEYPGAIWIHGGAYGFDEQVNYFPKPNSQKCIFRPRYDLFSPAEKKQAPLRRNDEMLLYADLVVACWDNRTSGGTYYTVKQAEAKGITVRRVTAIKRGSDK